MSESEFFDEHNNKNKNVENFLKYHPHRCCRCGHHFGKCKCQKKMFRYYNNHKNDCLCAKLIKCLLCLIIAFMIYKIIMYEEKKS